MAESFTGLCINEDLIKEQNDPDSFRKGLESPRAQSQSQQWRRLYWCDICTRPKFADIARKEGAEHEVQQIVHFLIFLGRGRRQGRGL